jgi:hypothetical protein
MSFRVIYTLDGAGWATCTVAAGDVHCEITASYLSDALGNLVAAAVATLSGRGSATVSFDEEPGEYRWVIEAKSPSLCAVQILEFPELWGNKPNSDGKSVFRAEVTPIVFGRAVHAAAASVLEKHGIEGYAKSWIQHPFPLEQFRVLENLVAGHENVS